MAARGRDEVAKCRIAGVVLGVVVFLWLLFVSGLSILAALFLAAVTGALFAALLYWATCEGRGGPAEDAELTSADWAPEPSGGVGAWSRALLEHEHDEPAGAAAPDADSEAGRHRGAAAGRIEPLRPRDAGQAAAGEDNTGGDGSALEGIKGIGPKMVEVLVAHGITAPGQIAGWSDADIAKFEQLLGRTGYRIRSDDWVGQARALTGAPDAAGKGGAAGEGGASGR